MASRGGRTCVGGECYTALIVHVRSSSGSCLQKWDGSRGNPFTYRTEFQSVLHTYLTRSSLHLRNATSSSGKGFNWFQRKRGKHLEVFQNMHVLISEYLFLVPRSAVQSSAAKSTRLEGEENRFQRFPNPAFQAVACFVSSPHSFLCSRFFLFQTPPTFVSFSQGWRRRRRLGRRCTWMGRWDC